MTVKRVSLSRIYETKTGSKYGVKLDGRIIGNIETNTVEGGYFYYCFPSTHILRRESCFFRALSACVKNYVAWIGNHGRI